MPNQGVQILYEVLNEQAGHPGGAHVLRVARSRGADARARIPQFTVDSHRPVRDFDVLGVSFSTELGYTNLLNALDLAGYSIAR